MLNLFINACSQVCTNKHACRCVWICVPECVDQRTTSSTAPQDSCCLDSSEPGSLTMAQGLPKLGWADWPGSSGGVPVPTSPFLAYKLRHYWHFMWHLEIKVISLCLLSWCSMTESSPPPNLLAVSFSQLYSIISMATKLTFVYCISYHATPFT